MPLLKSSSSTASDSAMPQREVLVIAERRPPSRLGRLLGRRDDVVFTAATPAPGVDKGATARAKPGVYPIAETPAVEKEMQQARPRDSAYVSACSDEMLRPATTRESTGLTPSVPTMSSQPTTASVPTTTTMSSQNVIPVENEGQFRGVSPRRNLALNPQNGHVLDEDTGEVVSVVVTTTTTTTTTTTRSNGAREHRVEVVSNPQTAPSAGTGRAAVPDALPSTPMTMPMPAQTPLETPLETPGLMPAPLHTASRASLAATSTENSVIAGVAEMPADSAIAPKASDGSLMPPVRPAPTPSASTSAFLSTDAHPPGLPPRSPHRSSAELASGPLSPPITSETHTSPFAPNTSSAAGTGAGSANFSQPFRSSLDHPPVSPTSTTHPMTSATIGGREDISRSHAPQKSQEAYERPQWAQGLKAAAVGLQGVGSTLKGTLSSEIDARFPRRNVVQHPPVTAAGAAGGGQPQVMGIRRAEKGEKGEKGFFRR